MAIMAVAVGPKMLTMTTPAACSGVSPPPPEAPLDPEVVLPEPLEMVVERFMLEFEGLLVRVEGLAADIVVLAMLLDVLEGPTGVVGSPPAAGMLLTAVLRYEAVVGETAQPNYVKPPSPPSLNNNDSVAQYGEAAELLSSQYLVALWACLHTMKENLCPK